MLAVPPLLQTFTFATLGLLTMTSPSCFHKNAPDCNSSVANITSFHQPLALLKGICIDYFGRSSHDINDVFILTINI